MIFILRFSHSDWNYRTPLPLFALIPIIQVGIIEEKGACVSPVSPECREKERRERIISVEFGDDGDREEENLGGEFLSLIIQLRSETA